MSYMVCDREMLGVGGIYSEFSFNTTKENVNLHNHAFWLKITFKNIRCVASINSYSYLFYKTTHQDLYQQWIRLESYCAHAVNQCEEVHACHFCGLEQTDPSGKIPMANHPPFAPGQVCKMRHITDRCINLSTTDDAIWRRLTLAACYQLAQSVLKIGFALAKKAG